MIFMTGDVWTCSVPTCPLETGPVVTPGATVLGEDSTAAESSRPQRLPVFGPPYSAAIYHKYVAIVDHRGYAVAKIGFGTEGMPDQKTASQCAKEWIARLNKSLVIHYDPTGKTREPPHCPSCHCETPSMLDQIRQNDKDAPELWFGPNATGVTGTACKNRRWLLEEAGRLQKELSRWEIETRGQVFVPAAEYAELCKRNRILGDIETAVKNE